MTAGHSPEERRYYAELSRKLSVSEVAQQARVKPATVRAWRSEFKISEEGSVSLGAARTAASAAAQDAAANMSTAGANSGDTELADIVRRARDSFMGAHGDWFDDPSCQEQAAAGLNQIVNDWEQEHGAFSKKEMKIARARLGE